MKKAARMVGSIKAALAATEQYIGKPESIRWDASSGIWVVEVSSLRALRQIPGEIEIDISSFPRYTPVCCSKEFDGITFICRMKEVPPELMKEAI